MRGDAMVRLTIYLILSNGGTFASPPLSPFDELIVPPPASFRPVLVDVFIRFELYTQFLIAFLLSLSLSPSRTEFEF